MRQKKLGSEKSRKTNKEDEEGFALGEGGKWHYGGKKASKWDKQ